MKHHWNESTNTGSPTGYNRTRARHFDIKYASPSSSRDYFRTSGDRRNFDQNSRTRHFQSNWNKNIFLTENYQQNNQETEKFKFKLQLSGLESATVTV